MANLTPLHEATKAAHLNAGTILRELGADSYAIDAKGKRPNAYETKKHKNVDRAMTQKSTEGTKNRKTKE